MSSSAKHAVTSQGMRLNKFLVSKGYGSRREVNEMVKNGFVRINGATATHELRVNPATDKLQMNPGAWQVPKTTVIFHKPLGIVSCQPEEGKGYTPAVQLLNAENYHLGAPLFRKNHSSQREPYQLSKMAVAGRLDINSTGLLLFTQCGQTASQIIGPDSQVEKEYLVRVSQVLVDQDGVATKRQDPFFNLSHAEEVDSNRGHIIRKKLEQLRKGVTCSGDLLQLESVEVLNDQQLRIVLRRGVKHHIRRMIAAVGWDVRALKRVRIGNLTLGNLPNGQWRYLGPEERLLNNQGDGENNSSFRGRRINVRARSLSQSRRNVY